MKYKTREPIEVEATDTGSRSHVQGIKAYQTWKAKQRALRQRVGEM